ncbi:DUF4234 domain-containing protein [Sporichthya polymorpha]|uniref:DUF4234 domain-containing protein n=1 Tax=Sporichthya polymorpha TaxID=35751 RepID=UPI00036D75C7|nr:DUF4234 domain-containing protein [Sporichthya polymorpha]
MTPDTSVLLSREILTYGPAPKRRRPAAVWFLGVATLGVYWVVWFLRANRELARFDERIPGSYRVDTTAFALGWPIGIPQFLALHRMARRIESAQRAAGLPVTCDPATGVLMWVCFGVGLLYLQDELNKVVDRYGAPAGTEVFHYA